jgi:hypothetical protein
MPFFGAHMRETKAVKMYFFVDESGDPTILGRRGKNLMNEGLVSKTFMVGYVEISDPKELTRRLDALRDEIVKDEYLSGVPSLASTSNAFHANKDCAEVKERVFRLLKREDFRAFIVVARKNEALFRKKFDLKPDKLYQYLVSKLFENRLHLYKHIDIYFASMGNIVRERTMWNAINEAIASFEKKWKKQNSNEIRVFVQQSSQLPMLQVVDYVLWTVNRAYERNDFRYYRFLSEKISLIQDVFDVEKYPHTYYTPQDPLDPKKMSPVGG